jgi:hypothetical protein
MKYPSAFVLAVRLAETDSLWDDQDKPTYPPCCIVMYGGLNSPSRGNSGKIYESGYDRELGSAVAQTQNLLDAPSQFGRFGGNRQA